MMIQVEFETVLENRGVIHVPEEIAVLLSEGASIRVSITPAPSSEIGSTPGEAWAATLAFIQERMAKGPLPGELTWRQEDAYDHLNRYGSDRAD